MENAKDWSTGFDHDIKRYFDPDQSKYVTGSDPGLDHSMRGPVEPKGDLTSTV